MYHNFDELSLDLGQDNYIEPDVALILDAHNNNEDAENAANQEDDYLNLLFVLFMSTLAPIINQHI